jgi:hypothetical protein
MLAKLGDSAWLVNEAKQWTCQNDWCVVSFLETQDGQRKLPIPQRILTLPLLKLT